MAENAINGKQLFDPQTGLWVPFESRSDALLAQLSLQHDLSRHHFNLLLDILLDPSFSREEITFRHASDVDECICKHRCDLAEERNRFGSLSPSRPTSAGLPFLILDLVIDRILEDARHFSYETDAPPSSPGMSDVSAVHDWRTDLQHMCLVHRSWTASAQRALRRRVIITNRRTLRDFARSPACGAGVRELAYKIPDICTFIHEDSLTREHWSTLASVLSRLKNLRFLCLRIETAHRADLIGFDLVLRAICDLTSLKGLWLMSSRDQCPYLPHLCVAISRLVNLRFLSICNWTCPRNGKVDHTPALKEILALTPPARLRALQHRDNYLTVPPAYLAWLFTPRNAYCLETLDLQVTLPRPRAADSHLPHIDSSHLLTALTPLLPRLAALALRLFYIEASSVVAAAAHDADVQALLAHATALRRVRLHRLRALELPASLEELHMHYTYSAVNWRTQDRRLHATLGAGSLPRLSRVVVSAGDAGPGGRSCTVSASGAELPRTRELCASRGVEVVSPDDVYLNQYVVDALS